MKRAAILSLALALLSVQAVRPEVELLLEDGSVLAGTEARRQGNVYVLEQENGQSITLPIELVREVRLIGLDKEYMETNPALQRAEPETLGGGEIDEAAPTGIQHGQAQTLAGQEVRPATPSEQTAALGEPAQFQKSIVDNEWKPETDWDMDPRKQNNFAPSTWSEDIVDSSWTPESAYDKNTDVLESGRSNFQQGVVDNSWQPTDAFANDGWGAR